MMAMRSFREEKEDRQQPPFTPASEQLEQGKEGPHAQFSALF